MAVVSAAHQKQIESAIADGKPEAAFSILQGYADLRHADMPPLSKGSLQAIAKNPAAVRRFVLGATSTSLSVRRFCRKYLPKVGEPAAGPLLALAAESLDPFRPGDGLFGSCGGVVSPLARTILDEKMGFEIKDGYAYSEAGRYGKEVMDDVVFLVGATSYDQLVRFCEYQWGAARISGRENAPDRNWPHADYFAPWTHQTVNETLAKNEQRWGETVVRWTSGRTLLLNEVSDDPVVCELARRVREGGEEGLSKLRENLLVQYARTFHGLSAEHRVALYQNLRAVVHTFGPKLKPYFDRTIEDYRRKYPDEAEQAARAANTPVTPAASDVDATATPAPGSGRTNAGGSQTVGHAGPGGERALLSVFRLAFEARLPRLHAAISLTLDEDLRDDDRPESGGSAEDERILAELHQAILAHRATRPGTDTSARPRWGEDRTYVPDQVLENAPFAAELADLLVRMIAPGRGFMLAAAGATLLSREGLRRFGEAWAVQARPAEQLYEDHANHILDPIAERQLAPIALLHAVFALEGQEFPLELTEGWQRAIAALYIRGGDAGRAAALDLLARYPYPKEVNEYCNRRDFYDAHQSTMWTAWERRDAEMLGLAFERFAIPYFWKGSKALLSKREPFFMRSGYAARSDTGEGAPLTEVWKLAASAGRTAATAKMAIRHAELCEAPRTLLDLAAPEDLDGLGDDVLVLLESSNAAVLATGLAILGSMPAIVKDRADEAVTLAARALVSTRSGAAKEAAVALAALGNAHMAVRQQAFSALADGLSLEAAPVLQAILKSMKSLPGKLPKDARERIVELSRSDPSKFEKLAKPLLAA